MSLGEQTLQTSAQSSQRKEASVLKDIQPCPARTEAAEPHGPAECPGTQKLTAAGLCQVPTGPAETCLCQQHTAQPWLCPQGQQLLHANKDYMYTHTPRDP